VVESPVEAQAADHTHHVGQTRVVTKISLADLKMLLELAIP
jgi:hypothetical protein